MNDTYNFLAFSKKSLFHLSCIPADVYSVDNLRGVFYELELCKKHMALETHALPKSRLTKGHIYTSFKKGFSNLGKITIQTVACTGL